MATMETGSWEEATVKEEPTAGVKRPADTQVATEDEPPSKVARSATNSFKNVFKQLSLMRPGLFFEMESEENATVNAGDTSSAPTYTMVVDVDGVKFRGTGPSKRNAKVVAAEQVLAHLESLGVKPRELTEAEKAAKPVEAKPKPETTPAVTSPPLTEEQKALQMMGKNPVMMLHEIRPNFECGIESDDHKGAHRKVVMSITVEGQKFLGSGRSNKNARARAAVSALETLFGLEFTDFGENEIPVYLGEEWAWRKFTKRAEKVAAPPSAQGKPIKNAVMQLNDMYKGLEFHVVERSGPDHCPFFKVSVDIEGQKYEGSGSTKKAAKLDAAEKALDGLALSGVLAQRASQKKQQKWGAQKGFTPNKKKGPQQAGFGAGAGAGACSQGENGSMKGFVRGGSTQSWNQSSWTGNNGQGEQNGQTNRGRGGRGQPRGQFRGQGRGGPMRGRGGQMRGRGAGGPPRGRGGTSSWGGRGNGQSGGFGRGRGGNQSSMLPPPLPPLRARGRGRGNRGNHNQAQSSTTGGWGQSASTSTGSYDYQDPYSDTSSGWGTSQGSYGGYDNSYDTTTYDASFETTSYDNTYDSSNFDSSYNNTYQADSSGWNDYYGY